MYAIEEGEVGGGRNIDYLTRSRGRLRGLAAEQVRDIARFSLVLRPTVV